MKAGEEQEEEGEWERGITRAKGRILKETKKGGDKKRRREAERSRRKDVE